jgi:hypothetical protein
MTSIVEDYLESPGMEQETDDVFPCKGCGDILEEGKAFELGMLKIDREQISHVVLWCFQTITSTSPQRLQIGFWHDTAS